MNTTEHLALIRAFCTKNLEIAAKRTPDWDLNRHGYLVVGIERNISGVNAKFIVTCHEAAEAGWKATIAAVDWILSSHELADAGVYLQDCVNGDIERLTDDILAAYPLTLIQP